MMRGEGAPTAGCRPDLPEFDRVRGLLFPEIRIRQIGSPRQMPANFIEINWLMRYTKTNCRPRETKQGTPAS
jgi:hypothetical protein